MKWVTAPALHLPGSLVYDPDDGEWLVALGSGSCSIFPGQRWHVRALGVSRLGRYWVWEGAGC